MSHTRPYSVPQELMTARNGGVAVHLRPTEQQIDTLIRAKRKHGLTVREIAEKSGLPFGFCDMVLSKNQYASIDRYDLLKKAVNALIRKRRPSEKKKCRAYSTSRPMNQKNAVPIADRPSEQQIDELMRARRRHNISYRQLADEAGISGRLCNDILNKKQYASLDRYARLKKALRTLIVRKIMES